MTRGKKSKSHGGSKATPKPEPTRRTTTRRTPKVEQHEIALTRKRPSSKRTRHSVAKGGPPSKSPAQSVLAANILTVLNADLARLGPGEAVDLIRELLCAEARRIGLSTTEINVSAAVNMPDGGIDASVTTGGPALGTSWLKPGRTSHQIKASAAFEPWKESHLRAELLGKKPLSRNSLGESVRRCLDEKGTYVLVCTKCDLDESRHNKAVDALKDLFAKCGYKNAKVEVWSQNTLVGVLHRFPSMRLKVNGRGELRFQTHKSWAQQEEMTKRFEADAPRLKIIADMRTELRSIAFDALHARVLGEPGIGKTRLVHEVAGAEDLEPLVIYCSSASLFGDSDLMNELLREDNDFCAILVIDECDAGDRAYIWDRLKNLGPRIKLITIHNEWEKTSGTTRYVNAPPLEKAEIVEIVHSYGVPKDRAARWTQYSGGSPRVAHVIGMNLKNNPDDLLREPDTINVWDRYIVGSDDPESENVRQRRVVLRHLALFKKCGYGGELVEEAKAVCRLAQRVDPSLTWPRFAEIVEELRGRRLLQGENTLYITPKLLHIKLWSDWWESYGHPFEFREFAADLPEALVVWFHEMSAYARESKAAQRVVARLLDEGGIFEATDYLEDPQGAQYFLALSEADPEGALRCLERTIGTWSIERLLNFTTGRREVVWALERIVIWRELFQRGARLLLRLAEAENETWGNNASGTFAGLFSTGPGAVASTEASPEERFVVLREALESDSKQQRLIGLRASDAALESSNFVRESGAEYQGLRREPELWIPHTWGEIFDAYRRVWELVRERLDALEEEERTKAIDVLLHQADGIGRYENVLDMVIDTLIELARKPYAPRKRMIETVARVLHYQTKDMPDQVRSRWVGLRNELVGTDFHSRMERYVALDLLEDKFDEQGREVDKTEPEMKKLAGEAIEHPEALVGELHWVVREAANGFRFGYALGTKDESWALLPMLLDAQCAAGAEANAFFLGGYFRVIREKKPDQWDKSLDDLIRDKALSRFVSELSWRGGFLTDRAARRVLLLAQRGILPIGDFRMFTFGSSAAELSEEMFVEWFEFLLSTSTRESVSIALNLHHFYYGRKESKHTLPKDLTRRLLIAAPLFAGGSPQREQMETYHWTELGKLFVRRYPGEGVAIAEKILEHFGEEGTIVGGFHSIAHEMLNEIMRQSPTQVWRLIAKYIGPPVDSRAYRITTWLRGERFGSKGEIAPLALIPAEEIWSWVDENVEKRAWYVASFVPKQLSHTEGLRSLAREVLVRYGARKDVRRNLIANFGAEGWAGPASLHYEARKASLVEYKRSETHAGVKRWIDEYVQSLDRQIERARIQEEREF